MGGRSCLSAVLDVFENIMHMPDSRSCCSCSPSETYGNKGGGTPIFSSLQKLPVPAQATGVIGPLNYCALSL